MNDPRWWARPRFVDAVDSWWRAGLILAIIVTDALWEEALVLGAEFMMLVRWTRDVIRYDLRWILQEKFRMIRRGDLPSRKES